MSDGPRLTDAAAAALAARKAREAAALRDNLRRRKAQGRDRAAPRQWALSGCVEMLFAAEHPGLPARIRAAAAAGLDAVEFWRWREKDLAPIRAACAETGLPVSVFSVDPVARLVDPATHGAFLQGVRDSITTARSFGTKRLIALSGDTLPGVAVEAQRDAVIAALRAAAPIAADAGVTLLLEPLNTALDHVGYFLDRTTDGLDIIDEVGHPAVRLLFDAYHSAMMEEDAASVLAGRGDRIGYVHAADRPGRHQPGGGTMDWAALSATLDEAGYRGPIGLEFRPDGPTVPAIATARTALNGG